MQKIQIAVGGAFLSIFLVAVVTQMVCRYLGIAAMWTEDVSMYSFIWAVFMGAGAMVHSDAHFAFTSVSEIAVILDQDSSYGCNTRYFREKVYNCLLRLGSVGAPHDVYLKGMVSKEQLQGYKLVLSQILSLTSFAFR